MYRWIHQDAEFVDEDGMDYESPYTSEAITTAFSKGAGMQREDNEQKYVGYHNIEEDLSVFANYIRVNLMWNEQEEVFGIYKRQ